MSGEIPPELGRLADLASLNLSGNGLSGAIPPELGQATNLTRLVLWGNELSGTIPPELADLTNLETLAIGVNSLGGPVPPELGRLTSLRFLHLGSNVLTGAILQTGTLGRLTNPLSVHHLRVSAPGWPATSTWIRACFRGVHRERNGPVNSAGPGKPEPLGQCPERLDPARTRPVEEPAGIAPSRQSADVRTHTAGTHGSDAAQVRTLPRCPTTSACPGGRPSTNGWSGSGPSTWCVARAHRRRFGSRTGGGDAVFIDSARVLPFRIPPEPARPSPASGFAPTGGS